MTIIRNRDHIGDVTEMIFKAVRLVAPPKAL